MSEIHTSISTTNFFETPRYSWTDVIRKIFTIRSNRAAITRLLNTGAEIRGTNNEEDVREDKGRLMAVMVNNLRIYPC